MFKIFQPWLVLLAFLAWTRPASAQPAPDSVAEPSLPLTASLTHLNQLPVYVNAQTKSLKTVRLEGVVTWAAAAGGAFVMQDATGALQFDVQRPEALPGCGQRVRLEGQVLLGGGEALLGQILAVENDGEHSMRERSARQRLQPGRYSLRLDYFQGGREDGLEVFYEGPGLPRQPIPAAALAHQADGTNWVAGLRVDYFEGAWSRLPDFDRLTPVRSEIATNFTLIEPNRGTNFGLRFTGAIAIPTAGEYRFFVSSDDGSRLTFDKRPWRLTDLGPGEWPAPQSIVPGQALTSEQLYGWAEVEGGIGFAGAAEGACRLDLSAGPERMVVNVARGDGRWLQLLAGAHVKIRGACGAAYNDRGSLVASQMLVNDLGQVAVERLPLETWQRYPSNSIANLLRAGPVPGVVHLEGVVRETEGTNGNFLEDDSGSIPVDLPADWTNSSGTPVEALGWLEADASQLRFEAGVVQSAAEITGESAGVMPVERIRFMNAAELQRGPTVKIRGVVTMAQSSWEATVNDGEYGISCWFDNPILPLNPGDYVEVEGTVRAGAFGPNLGEARVKVRGRALLPQPVRPAWDRLINGSLEQQWVEIEGVVQKIQDNQLTVEMNGGRIQVQVATAAPGELAALQDAIVRIRGTVVPIYNGQRQILGVKLWVSSPLDVNVEQPALADPFSAPLKSVAQLSRFDPGGASAFYRVKVRGQILAVGAGDAYLADGSNGLAFLPKTGQKLAAGDYAEVVGFPELGGAVPLLQEALVKTNGHAAVPAPLAITLEDMLAGDHDATRVKVEGVLINVTSGQTGENLELQVGPRVFTARLGAGQDNFQTIPPGSRLRLTGTCVGHGWRGRGAGFESVELLLNSAADVQVLQLPPWWNARRILALVVTLAAVLLLSLAWVYLLRRKVEQRTAELNREMRQRKEIELQHAAEQERSRIARDLHDDLGSSLTEISLLASVGLPLMPAAGDRGSQPPERFGVIAGKARLLVKSLDVIVWAADPEEDEIQSFVDYLSGFASEFLAASGLACRFKIPIEFPPLRVDGRIRHGLFLAVKETLNNVVRHAQATEVEFRLNLTGRQIEIVVADNGRGFDAATVQRGNGLSNLRERLADLGGRCEIASQPGAGTTVKIQMTLKSAA